MRWQAISQSDPECHLTSWPTELPAGSSSCVGELTILETDASQLGLQWNNASSTATLQVDLKAETFTITHT